MTRRQRLAKHRNRVSLWRKVVGARPAWLISLLVAILGGASKEWLAIRDRINTLESATQHTEQTLTSETERLRRMINRRCAEVCGS